jgi:hypothetical protein
MAGMRSRPGVERSGIAGVAQAADAGYAGTPYFEWAPSMAGSTSFVWEETAKPDRDASSFLERRMDSRKGCGRLTHASFGGLTSPGVTGGVGVNASDRCETLLALLRVTDWANRSSRPESSECARLSSDCFI